MTDEELVEKLRREGDQPEPLFDQPRFCKNPGCGRELVQRRGEYPSSFKARELCNARCRHEYLTVPVAEARTCASPKCGKRLERRIGESRDNFKKRVTCNHSCAASSQKRPPAPAARTCQNPECGQPFGRRLNETWPRYLERRFCGRPCYLAVRRTEAAASKPEAAPKQALKAAVKPRQVREPDIDLRRMVDEWDHFSGYGWPLSRFAREMKVSVASLVRAAERKPQVGAEILAAWARECERKAS